MLADSKKLENPLANHPDYQENIVESAGSLVKKAVVVAPDAPTEKMDLVAFLIHVPTFQPKVSPAKEAADEKSVSSVVEKGAETSDEAS